MTRIETTFTLADFITSNGILLKLKLIDRSKKGEDKSTYLDLDYNKFSAFKKGTTFSGSVNSNGGVTIYDAVMIYEDLSKYLNLKIELLHGKAKSGFETEFDSFDLDEDVCEPGNLKIVRDAMAKLKGTSLPQDVMKNFTKASLKIEK